VGHGPVATRGNSRPQSHPDRRLEPLVAAHPLRGL